MAASHFDQFLAEATIPDPDPTHRLRYGELFGLYVSWCNVHQHVPGSEASFRVAMRARGITGSAQGRRMTGPAAMDYILASYPALP